MEYILRNENYYCYLSKTNGVKKTTEFDRATKFKSAQAAKNIKEKACAKLKNYEVYEVESGNIIIPTKRKVIPSDKRRQVYNKNQGRCVICGKFVEFDNFTIDHIIPLSKGGTNQYENLQCTCKTCNQLKQDILPEDLFEKIVEIITYQIEVGLGEGLIKMIISSLIKRYTKCGLITQILKKM